MKILIDLQACQSGSRFGGIGRYSLALAQAMARQCQHQDLHILLSGLLPQAEFDIKLAFSELLPPERIKSFSAVGPVAACDPNNRPNQEISTLLREDFIRRLEPDIVHVSSLIEGWGDDVVTSIDDALADRTAVTWYDLIPYVMPEMYLSDPAIAAHYYGKVEEAKKARCLLAISEFSRQEAVSVLKLDPTQVVNIQSAAGPEFRKLPISSREVSQLRAAFGIDRPYLMYTGSFDTRKNQASLIKAFARLPIAVRDKYQLVIVGNGWPSVYEQLQRVASEAGLPQNSVIFTGRINDDQLLLLYNLCHLLVFPSLCEGFGLPILEAMSCGTPAIGSNCTSVPEVIGRDDALFDPRSVESITHKMNQVLSNEGFRQELISHASVQCQKFSWDASAKIAIQAFENIVDHDRSVAGRIGPKSEYSGYQHLIEGLARVCCNEQASPKKLQAIAIAIENNEQQTTNVSEGTPRTGWVTTWGSRCGIASYSQFLVESSPDPVHAIFAQRIDRKNDDASNVHRCWSANGEDDLRELERQLDAQKIQVVIIQFNYGFYDFPALNRLIAKLKSAGRRIVMTLHSTQDPPANILSKKLFDLKASLLSCDRVVVHTSRDEKTLLEMGVSRNVSVIPQGVYIPQVECDQSSSDVNELVIASYGFFLPHKGLLELIEAFGVLHKKYPKLRLKMVNAEYSPIASGNLIQQAKRRIDELRLSKHIQLLTDYLSDEQTHVELSSADLVVYPYQQTGESSSAAVRMGLASRRLVAVTPLPIFADVADVTTKLPGTDPSAIASGLEELLEQIRRQKSGETVPELLRAQEKLAAWLTRHNVKKIAIQFGQACRTLNQHYSNAA